MPREHHRFFRPLPHESFGYLLLLGMVTSIQAICTTLTLPALPAIANEFGTTPEIAQFTISGFLLGVAGGQILSGALSDRFGRRPVLLGGIAISAIAGIVCTFAPSVEVLIPMRVVQGMGAAAGMILGRAIVRDQFAREHAQRAMSTILSMVSVMPMVGPPVTGVLLHWFSWRGIYGFVTLTVIVLGVMTWMWIAESNRHPDATATAPGRVVQNCLEMIRSPASMSFVLVSCISYGGLYCFFAAIAFIDVDVFHISAANAGWMLGCAALATWAGSMISNCLAGRWPMGRILRTSTAVCAGTAVAMLILTQCMAHGWLAADTPALVLMMFIAMVYCMAFGVGHPNSIVMYLRPLPHIAGTAAALGASFQTLTGALFAWLVTALYDGTPAALGYCLTLAGVGCWLVFVLMARRFAPR